MRDIESRVRVVILQRAEMLAMSIAVIGSGPV